MQYKLEIKDHCPSVNSIYSGLHWTKRKKLADEKHELIKWAVYMNKDIRKASPISKCTIDYVIHYKDKRRHDNSNAFIKLYEDGLVKSGIIPDDDSKHITSISVSVTTGADEDKIIININEV